MKKAVVIGACVGLMSLRGEQAHADGEDDYGVHFGDDNSASAESAPREAGPNSIEEARQQHRGYRIGQREQGGELRAPRGNDIHVVADGDTLWDISDHYFGDPWHWPELWSFNPEITNPHWIYPQDQIRLDPGALTSAQATAMTTSGGLGTGGLREAKPSSGILAGTETASSVVVPKGAFQPGTVFLRDQGYLDNEALRTAGRITGGNEEQMFLSPSDQAYITFKPGVDVRAGQTYTVFRTMRPEERAEEEEGTLVRILGMVVVRSFDRDKQIARAIVTESVDPIERGMFVAQLDRRFDLVGPRRNQVDVSAKVIANVQPKTLIGYGDVVFLDVGAGKGIEPGNRFFVVRRGDAWLSSIDVDPVEVGNASEVPEYDEASLPKEVFAELRVLKVRKNTTIALVVRSDTDLKIGDRAEMRIGF